MQAQELNQAIEQLISPITVSFEFVPYSEIVGTDREWKHDGKPTKALHYNVIFKDGDRELWRTNYAMGVGYIPGYKNSPNLTHLETVINTELEEEAIEMGEVNDASILPAITDVIHCLVSDADVLNYSNFEEWANEFGYDTDSRSAEKTYKQCLESALSLRNLLSENKLADLRELLSDY